MHTWFVLVCSGGYRPIAKALEKKTKAKKEDNIRFVDLDLREDKLWDSGKKGFDRLEIHEN